MTSLQQLSDLREGGIQVERDEVLASLRQRMFGVSAQTQVGRFVIRRRLGEGGMGIVYAAHDPQLDREIALKMLKSRDASERQRLFKEARAMARLAHPNVVAVHDVGEQMGETYIAMELVCGLTLSQWAAEDRRTWHERLEVLLAAGEGLAAAHRAAVVHRDFKPSNVLVGSDGRPRVTDFGVAATTTLRSTEGSQDLEADTQASGGTPAYCAPEVRLGRPASSRSDQYSFCVSAWEVLFGVRPPASRRLNSGSRQQRNLAAVLRPGLSADPDSRYPCMDDLLARLRRVSGRRRWPLALGLLATGAVGAVAADAMVSPPSPSCHDGQLELATVWNEERKAQLQEAFEASGLPYARSMTPHIVERLDGLTQAWVTAYDDNCRATRTQARQSAELMDLRAQCLRGQRAELAAAIETLASADAEVVRHAPALVLGLPDPSGCADESGLRRERRPAPRLRPAAEALEQQVARARADRLVGRYEAGLALGQAAGAAESVASYPVAGWAWHEHGLAQWDSGALEEAESSLRRSAEIALSAGADRLAFRAMLHLAELFVLGSQPRRGDDWLGQAEAVAKRLGSDPASKAALEHARALTLTSQRKFEASVAARRRRRAFLEQEAEPRPMALAAADESIAIALIETGAFEEALEHVVSARQRLESLVGPEHPHVASCHVSEATALLRLARLDEAREHYTRATQIYAAALGPDNIKLAPIEDALGVMAILRGERDKSIAHHERALAIFESSMERPGAKIVATLGRLGDAHVEVDPQRALQLFTRARSIIEAEHGAKHPQTVSFIGRQCGALRELERLDEAKARCEEALGRARRVMEPTDLQIAVVQEALARVFEAQHEPAEALPLYTESLERIEAIVGVEHPALAYSLFGMGKAHLAMGRPTRARPLIERALALPLNEPELERELQKLSAQLDTRRKD